MNEPRPSAQFRTASDEHAGPGNEARFHPIEESHSPVYSIKNLYTTFSFYYNVQRIKNYFTGFVHVRSKYCSLANSARHICIARSWKLRFAMITSVRAKLFTDSSGKTSLDLSKCFSRIGCWAYGGWLYCYTTWVAAGRSWLPFCIISCMNPHYFCAAFLRFGFHSCINCMLNKV